MQNQHADVDDCRGVNIGETSGLFEEEKNELDPFHVSAQDDHTQQTRYTNLLAFDPDAVDFNLPRESGLYDVTDEVFRGTIDEATSAFEWDELPTVLSHYDIGIIQRMTPLLRGSRKSPKCVVLTEKGEFLIKRMPEDQDGVARRKFIHAFQYFLSKALYPVPPLIGTKRSRSTLLRRRQNIYEIYEFVRGYDYVRKPKETAMAGRALGELHAISMNFLPNPEGLRKGSYHHSKVMLEVFERLPKTTERLLLKEGEAYTSSVVEQIHQLKEAYQFATAEVKQCRSHTWEEGVCHGDWHPGNLIYDDSYTRISAVVDFESARVQPWFVEVAQGALTFSTVASSRVENWKVAPDIDRLLAFFRGYCEVSAAPKISPDQCSALPWLMLQATMAETLLPLLARGYFAHVRADKIIQYLIDKTEWTKNNSELISEVIFDHIDNM